MLDNLGGKNSIMRFYFKKLCSRWKLLHLSPSNTAHSTLQLHISVHCDALWHLDLALVFSNSVLVYLPKLKHLLSFFSCSLLATAVTVFVVYSYHDYRCLFVHTLPSLHSTAWIRSWIHFHFHCSVKHCSLGSAQSKLSMSNGSSFSCCMCVSTQEASGSNGRCGVL